MGNQTQAAQMIQTYLAISPTMAVNLVKMGVSGGLEERRKWPSLCITLVSPLYIIPAIYVSDFFIQISLEL